MKMNSPQSAELARAVLRAHGGNWLEVRRAGTLRSDGVIVVPRPRDCPSSTDLKRTPPTPVTK